jgi:hypothetical protein
VCVLVLAKPDVGAGDQDVGDQMQFVAHVPGIAMDNRDQGLAELLGPGEGIEHAILHRERLAGLGQGREGVDVDAAGEVLAMAEEHRGPQARVVVEVVVCLGQAEERVRVEPAVALGPVDPDRHDLAAPLDGDLGLNLGAGAIVGDMSEIPLGDESGEVAAGNVDGKAKLDDEAEAEAEVEAQLDAEAEAEAEGEL